MGDMADAILNGDFCQICGEFIGPGDGYPVTCPACDSEDDDDIEFGENDD